MPDETRYRYEFHWRQPRLTVYRAATRHHVRTGLNRYPGVVIGAAVQVGWRVVSLTWGRPGKAVPL
jgi:hypothetical protein